MSRAMVFQFENEALRWNPGSHIPKGADLGATSRALLEIRRRDKYLHVDNVTDAAEAEPESVAWSPFFEWDSELAVRKYHEMQAGELLRSFVVVKIEGQEVPPVRAFSVVTLPSGQRSYEPTPLVIKHVDQKAELIAQVEAAKKESDDKFRELMALIKLL